MAGVLMMISSCGSKNTEESGLSLKDFKSELTFEGYYVEEHKGTEDYVLEITGSKTEGLNGSAIDYIRYNNESDAREAYNEQVEEMQKHFRVGATVETRGADETLAADDPDRNKLRLVAKDGYELSEIEFEDAFGTIVRTPIVTYYVYRKGTDVVVVTYNTDNSESVEKFLSSIDLYTESK